MTGKVTIRSIHLLSDKKFVPWVKNTFTLPGWTCLYILINHRKKKSVEQLKEDTYEVSTDRYGEQFILDQLESGDIVFHYFLDNRKADIIAKSPPHLVHCWCFYGAEIYQQTSLFRDRLYGPQTRKLLARLPEVRFRYDLRRLYYQYVLFRKTPIRSLREAIPKVHAILWYVEEEIQWINAKITLPPWKFFQFFQFSDIIPEGTGIVNTESKSVLLGNSATVENNHADALQMLTRVKQKGYTISLPLTYGQFKRYKSTIKELYTESLGESAVFLEDHMELSAYYHFLQQHPTAVFLHYRQQALGNILYMLYVGTKVYLSNQNVVITWLKNNGVKVFTFEEDFVKDIQTLDLTLTKEVMNMNRRSIEKLLRHDRNAATIQSLEAEVLARQKQHKK